MFAPLLRAVLDDAKTSKSTFSVHLHMSVPDFGHEFCDCFLGERWTWVQFE